MAEETVNQEAQAPEPAPKTKGKKKSEAAASSTTVQVYNRTARTVVVVDANGEGVHLLPKARVELDSKRLSEDFTRLERLGVLRIR